VFFFYFERKIYYRKILGLEILSHTSLLSVSKR